MTLRRWFRVFSLFIHLLKDKRAYNETEEWYIEGRQRGIFFAWSILPFMNNISMQKHNRILTKIRHLIASNTNMSYCSDKYIKFKTTE